MASIVIYKKGKSEQITDNFWSHEFDCQCGYSDCQLTFVDIDHIAKLQKKRNKWQKPIKITSGFRCKKHNKDVGGSEKSRHIVSDATDIQVNQMSPDEVANNCEDMMGLGRYNTFTHIDSRPWKARWDFRTKNNSGD